MIITDDIARKAADHFAKHDPVIAELVVEFGLCPIRAHTDHYRELVESIIGQQLSVSAARAINHRFLKLFGGIFPSPDILAARDPDDLRAIGLSYRKADYIKDLAAHIIEGKVQFTHLPDLSNQEIVAEMTAVKGIGEWTVHMFLIFCMARSDVLPVGDLGIKNAVQVKYNIGHRPIPGEIEAIAAANAWHPYESIAAWYLWQSLGNKPALTTTI